MIKLTKTTKSKKSTGRDEQTKKKQNKETNKKPFRFRNNKISVLV
jgi:hypothetical protein